jgi:hypothetical protein
MIDCDPMHATRCPGGGRSDPGDESALGATVVTEVDGGGGQASVGWAWALLGVDVASHITAPASPSLEVFVTLSNGTRFTLAATHERTD